MTFELEFEKFLEQQKKSAKSKRLEQLNRDLTGTRKMFQAVLWPEMKSFDGFIIEHELLSTSGVKFYVDAFYEPLRFAFESEGFVSHAENITRDRFMFERLRCRTLALYGYKYIPFAWDELEKKPEVCCRSLYEMLGRFSGRNSNSHLYADLSVNEREVIRYALGLNRRFRLADVCYCLGLAEKRSRVVLRSLLAKQLIRPTGTGTLRFHEYILEQNAADYIHT